MCHGPFFLMGPVHPVLPGEGRWLTGDASARASEETGVQEDPVQPRLDELLRTLESEESLIRTLQANRSLFRKSRQKLPDGLQKQQNHSHDRMTMLGGMDMIIGLAKAAGAGTIGGFFLGATPSQRMIPRRCRRGMETQNFVVTVSLMSSCTKEVRTQVILRLISGLSGRAREHLRMAGDLDRSAVDGRLEQFLEY